MSLTAKNGPNKSSNKSITRKYSKPRSEIVLNPTKTKFESIPVDLRGRVRTNQVDLLRDQARAFNGIKQPRWDVWPLESKVPDIRGRVWPIDSVYYTRGKVGQPLNRKPLSRIPKMKMYDPQGEYVPAKSYTALHDPHARKYFEIPEVQNLLRKQRLVNDKREVICSIKEYNQFRKYLATFENETINDKLQKQADIKDFHTNVQLPFAQYMKKKEHPAVLHGRKPPKDAKDERVRAARQDIDKRKASYEARMDQFRKKQQEKILNSMAEAQDREIRAQRKRMQIQKYHLQLRRDILHNAMVDMGQAVTNKKDYEKMMRHVKHEVQRERALARQTFENHDTELMEVVREAVRRQKKHWLTQYDKRLNAATQTLEYLKEAAEKKRKRQRFLERKYFDLWRAYVKGAQRMICTPNHTSLFRVEHDMRRMVEWLDQETGYELVMAVVRKTLGQGQGVRNIRTHFEHKAATKGSNNWSRKNSKKTSLGRGFFKKPDAPLDKEGKSKLPNSSNNNTKQIKESEQTKRDK